MEKKFQKLDIYDSHRNESIIVCTDAPNEYIRQAVSAVKNNKGYRNIFDVLRNLTLGGFDSRVLYDSRKDPKEIKAVVGYDSFVDIADIKETMPEDGWTMIFDRIAGVLNGNGMTVISRDAGCMAVKIAGLDEDFIMEVRPAADHK